MIMAVSHSPTMSCSVPNVAQVVCEALRNQIRVKVMKWKVRPTATARFQKVSLASHGLTLRHNL